MKSNTKPYLICEANWGKYGEFVAAPSPSSAVAIKVDNLRSIMNSIQFTSHVRLKNRWPSVHFILWYETLRRRITFLPQLNINHDPDQLVQGRVVKDGSKIKPARLAKGRWEVLIP